jgi:hypothetical protein
MNTIKDNYLDAFSASMTTKYLDAKLEIKNRTDDLALSLTNSQELADQINSSQDASLIDLLEAQIELLKGQIQCRDLKIYALEYQLESYELTNPLSEMADKLNEKALDIQEGMIAHHTAKIDKYKAGPKKKSSDSQQKWTLANEYFKEEISAHRTLKAARLAAAKKAGIVAEERQLTKMMPNPL